MAPPPKQVLPNTVKTRDLGVQGLIERGGAGGGRHKNKQDFDRGHARSPKHKNRSHEESMVDLSKTASSFSLAQILHEWWGDVYSELVAECVIANWEVRILKREPSHMRVRITLENPFEKGKLLDGPNAPHISVLLKLNSVQELEVILFLGKAQRKLVIDPLKVVTPAISGRVYDAARDLFHRTPLY